MQDETEVRQGLAEPPSGAWNWRDSQTGPVDSYPTTEPTNPGVGQLWFDATVQALYIWDGAEWLEVPGD
jgi:hypothetical protein